MRLRLAKTLLPAHLATAIVALVTLAMWPPSSGKLLVVLLGHGDANAVAKIALAGGASLLGPGPFPGSLVVIGERSRVARQAASWNLVITAAPAAGCGASNIAEASA